MRTKMLKLLALLIIATALVHATVWAQSAGFNFTKVVETGDRAPDSVTFAGFSTVAINDSGAVAFIAGDGTGVYRRQGGTITPIATTGEPVPGITGAFYDEITTATINNRGDIAFVASLLGTRTGPVLFLYTAVSQGPPQAMKDDNGIPDSFQGSMVQALVFSGTQVPGPVFANFQDFLNVYLNDNGDVAFTGKFRDTESGAFLYSGGMVRFIAITNQDAPGTGSQFRAAGAQSLANDGTMIVVGFVRSTTIQTGLFLYQNEMLQQVFLGGQPIPGVSPTDRFIRFSNARLIDQNGTLVFEGGGVRSVGIFTLSGGTVRAVLMGNETGPGTGNKRLVEFFPLAANLAGEVAFNASLEQGQYALFRYTHSTRTLRSVVVSDQQITGSFARRYIPSGAVSMNSQGAIVFSGSTVTPGTEGVYQASGTTFSALVTSQMKVPESRLRLGSDLAQNNRGAVAFTSLAAGNGLGVYLSQAASPGLGLSFSQAALLGLLVAKGQAAPGAGEGRIGDITNLQYDRTALTEQNDVAMVADIVGSTSDHGVFRASPGTLQSVALAGAAAPGIAQTSFSSFNQAIINNQGVVTFTGFITQRGESNQALIQRQGQTTVILAASDQAVSGTGGARFDSLTRKDFWVNNSGDVVFVAGLDDEREGVFLYTNRQITPMALTGQTVPGLDRVTFDTFGSVMINNQKTIVFTAELSNGGQGVFTWSNGQLRSVALSNQPVPGVTDRTFTTFGTTAINDSGNVVFTARWSNFTQGVFLFSAGTLTPVALHAQQVVELGNHRFTAFYGIAINNREEIVFVASFDGAPVPSVIVRATLEQAPMN